MRTPNGRMPGMATSEELAELRLLRGLAFDSCNSCFGITKVGPGTPNPSPPVIRACRVTGRELSTHSRQDSTHRLRA